MNNISISRNLIHIVASLAISSALFAACTSSQNSTNGTSYSRTENGSSVQVYEDEYKIHMPIVFPGPMVTFHVTNSGKMEHSFKIKGNGVVQELARHLAPGETEDMMANLPPGTYEVICPIVGHADLGMRLTVTVQ